MGGLPHSKNANSNCPQAASCSACRRKNSLIPGLPSTELPARPFQPRFSISQPRVSHIAASPATKCERRIRRNVAPLGEMPPAGRHFLPMFARPAGLIGRPIAVDRHPAHLPTRLDGAFYAGGGKGVSARLATAVIPVSFLRARGAAGRFRRVPSQEFPRSISSWTVPDFCAGRQNRTVPFATLGINEEIAARRPFVAGHDAGVEEPVHLPPQKRQRGRESPILLDRHGLKFVAGGEMLEPLGEQFRPHGGKCRFAPTPEVVPGRSGRSQFFRRSQANYARLAGRRKVPFAFSTQIGGMMPACGSHSSKFNDPFNSVWPIFYATFPFDAKSV